MVDIITVIFAFSYSIFYCIYGSVLSYQITKEINYEKGFIIFWNRTQLAMFGYVEEVVITEESTFNKYKN